MSRVLIIGATSAIASAMTRRFAEEEHKLFLLARNKQSLEALSQSLSPAPVGTHATDFNDTQMSREVIKQAYDTMGSIDIAIIAHGYIGDQIKSETDYEHAENIVQTNFLSVISLLIPLSQIMEKQGHGKIGVMTSVAGDRGRPRNYTYGAAKGALDLYLQGLRSKLWHSGVEVYSFKLGPVETPMTVDHKKNFSFSSIDNVVDIMLKTLNSKRYTRYVPGYWFWIMWAVRWMPESIFQRLGFLSNR